MSAKVAIHLSLAVALFAPAWIYAKSITLNSTDLKQTITMMGGDMERSSIAIQSSKNKEEMIQWGFGDIAFNTCRVQYDKNQELVEGAKNWGFYTKQINTMKAIKAINPNIQFFATLRSDYDGYGDENNMPDWIVDYATRAVDVVKHGRFLADYVEHMSQQGVPIAVMSVSKEWSSYITAEKSASIIATLRDTLAARKIAMPLISDQGFWSLSQGLTYMKKVSNLGTKNLYASFSTHNYSSTETQTWNSFVAYANTLGIPVVHDEFSTGAGGPSSGAEPAMSKPIRVYVEKTEAYAAGIAGEVFFEIWSRGLNNETRAIYCPWAGTGRRLRGYYIMKQFANNILDHRYVTTMVDSLPDVHTMSFRKDNRIILWVINKGTATLKSIPVATNGSTLAGPVSVTYWTDSTAIEGVTRTISPVQNVFVDSIEAQSMKCYVITLAIPVTSVTVSPSAESLAVGKMVTLSASVLPATATIKSLTWSTSNAKVATVSSVGVVTATGVGVAAITAKTADGGKAATSTINVAKTTSTQSRASSERERVRLDARSQTLRIDLRGMEGGHKLEIYSATGILLMDKRLESPASVLDVRALGSGIFIGHLVGSTTHRSIFVKP